MFDVAEMYKHRPIALVTHFVPINGGFCSVDRITPGPIGMAVVCETCYAFHETCAIHSHSVSDRVCSDGVLTSRGWWCSAWRPQTPEQCGRLF